MTTQPSNSFSKIDPPEKESRYQIQAARQVDDPIPILTTCNEEGKWIPLSGQYSPSTEAARILKKNQDSQDTPSLICLLGIGNIALVAQTLAQYPRTPLLIFAEHDDLVRTVLHALEQFAKDALAALRLRLNKQPPDCMVLTAHGLYDIDKHSAKPSSASSMGETQEETSSQAEAISPIQRRLQQDLEKIFQIHSTKLIRFFHNPREISLSPSFYQYVQNAIHIEQEGKAINRATFSRFERLWARNLIKNTRTIINASPVQPLIDALAKQPIVIVGAAPSLEDELPILRKHQGRIIIIAVDTAYSVLLKHGINPHIVVSIDPQKVNAKYLEIIPDDVKKNTVLLAEPSISPYGLRKFPYVFMFDNFSPYYEYLSSFFSAKGALSVGGSVATVAFELTRQTTPHAVCLVGIDLAYSRERYHLRGTFHEESWFSSLHRFNSFESLIFSIMDSKDVIPVASLPNGTNSLPNDTNGLPNGTHGLPNGTHGSGQKLYTDAAMALYKRWFEQHVEDLPFQVFNASTRGQPLSGIPFMPLTEFIETYGHTQDADETRSKKFQAYLQTLSTKTRKETGENSPDYAKRLSVFTQATRELISRIHAYKHNAEQASEIIRQVQKYWAASTAAPRQQNNSLALKQKRLIEKLDKHNAILQQPSIEKGFIGGLIQETLYAISDTSFESLPQAQSPNEDQKSSNEDQKTASASPNSLFTDKTRLEKAALLYGEVATACTFKSKLLEDLLSEIDPQ